MEKIDQSLETRLKLFDESFEQSFKGPLINELNRENAFLEELLEVVQKVNQKTAEGPPAAREVLAINDLITSHWGEEPSRFGLIDNAVQAGIKTLDRTIDRFEVSLKSRQSDERFTTMGDESPFVRFAKRWKRVLRGIQQRFSNVWQTLRRKQKRKVVWKYQIPLRDLIGWHFKSHFLEQWQETVDFTQKTITSVQASIFQNFDRLYTQVLEANNKVEAQKFTNQQANEVKNDADMGKDDASAAEEVVVVKADNGSDVKDEAGNIIVPPWTMDELLAAIESGVLGLANATSKCESDLKRIRSVISVSFEDEIKIAGTVEMPARKISGPTRAKRDEKAAAQLSKIVEGWNVTYFALMEDWALSLDVFNLNIDSYFDRDKYRDGFDDKLNNNIRSHSTEIVSYCEGLMQQIKGAKSLEDLKGVLKLSLYKSKKEFNHRLVNAFVDAIIKQNLTGLIRSFQYELNAKIEATSDSRKLDAGRGYSERMKIDRLSEISPREILQSLVSDALEKDFDRMANLMIDRQSDLVRKSSGLGQMLSINLESSIESIDDEASLLADTIQNSQEAIQRIILRVEETMNLLDDTQNELNAFWSELGTRLYDSTRVLTENENAIALKLKLVKARTLRRGRRIRIAFWKWVQEFLVKSRQYAVQGTDFVRTQIFRIRKIAGLTAEATPSSGISEFLTQANSQIRELPYFYQRLFSTEPLEDFIFFTNRSKELEQMVKAFETWKRGNHAATAVFGEMGGGKTSLVNYFLANQVDLVGAKTQKVPEIISSTKELLKFLGLFFGTDEVFKSKEDFIEKARKRNQKFVLVIRNAERLFEKRIGGFQAIKDLAEIISQTNSHFFWIVTFGQYAWNYLSKTVRIQDHFEFQVALSDLNQEDIKETIDKRNQISGYRITYLPSNEDKVDKNYIKLDDVERQLFLEKKFFANLQRFCKSNISLSLLFWMISALEKDEETMEIQPFFEMDLSFVANINRNALFLLHSFILSGAMTEEQLCAGLGLQSEKVRFTLLAAADDGLVIQNENRYSINPLIYRYIVQILRERNMIH